MKKNYEIFFKDNLFDNCSIKKDRKLYLYNYQKYSFWKVKSFKFNWENMILFLYFHTRIRYTN
jgi:hypothetical protein